LNKEYNEKCDIWSVGVIAYILLSGYPPFNGDTDEQIMNKIKKGKFTYPKAEWKSISSGAINFINKMLAYEPNDRYSAEEALNDPWIANCEQIMDLDDEVAKQALQNMKTFRVRKSTF
jgi:calcium-dependent protein kinase